MLYDSSHSHRDLTCGQNGVILATPGDRWLRISAGRALHLHRIALGGQQRLCGTVRNDRRPSNGQRYIGANMIGHGQHHVASVQTSVRLLDVLDL